QHAAGGDVIGMSVVPVRNGDRARLTAPDQIDGRSDHVRRFGDAAVGPAEVLTPRGAEYACRFERFSAPLLARAVARQFAFGQIAEADGVSSGRVARDRAAEADLDVVGMRTENEQVQRHGSLFSPD